jgi:hypothetical protein
MEHIRQAMTDYEARFRLPEINEATRLITQIQNSTATPLLTLYLEETSSLQRAIEAMRSPWLDAANALRSIGGFAKLQGIGQALPLQRHID